MASLRQELQSLEEEMNTSFSKLQVRLTDLSRRSEEVDNFWQTRVVELEGTIRDTLNNSQRISHQNAELERRIAQQKPEMDNAIDARSALFQKLRNAYRVIIDLGERVVDRNGNQLSDQEIAEVLSEAFSSERSPSGASSYDSNATIRERDHRHSEPSPTLRPESRLEQPQSSTESSVADEPTNVSMTSSSDASSSLSVHSGQSQNPAGGGGRWQIHYSKLPGSTEVACGPMSPRRVMKRLEGRQELRESIDRLELQDDFSLRVHIDGNMAFVYDPIFLEASSQTLLLDWGTEAMNEGTAKYIAQNENTVFHTFVFPVQKNNWYYVGAQAWDMKALLPTWPELGPNSRRKIIKKLRERCKETVEEQEIIRRLDNGELREFCVQISSIGHYERSRDLVRRMGFEDPAGSPTATRSRAERAT